MAPPSTAHKPHGTLDICHLSFSFGETVILEDISLSVAPGEICGLLGPNGSGKSTLFRCCMGFLHPTDGGIYIDGINTAHMPPSHLARFAAYVPQEHRQVFPFTVEEMVLMGRTPHMSGLFSVCRPKDREKAREAMERIGILPLAQRPYCHLSGGQRQLVLIARALAQDTPLIILDEPTSALDLSNQIAVWKILREVAQSGVSILVCCHDPNHILWFCDSAAVLSEKKICAAGPAAQAVTQDVLQRLYGPDCVRLDADGRAMACPSQAITDKEKSTKGDGPDAFTSH